MVAQVSSAQKIHHQVQVLSVLESILHVHYKTVSVTNNLLVLQLCQNFSFIENRIDAAFVQNAGLGHFLHGEELSVFLALNLPDFSKATLPNRVVVGEKILLHWHVHLHVYFHDKQEEKGMVYL